VINSSLGLGRALRTTKRARDILTVLVRHGYADIAEEIGLDRAWYRARRLVSRGREIDVPHHVPDAVRLRRMFEQLGTTFIKLGQVLSTRPDLVPEDWSLEFKKLQSEVPPAPWKAVREVLVESLGPLEERFETVEELPLAAASIAQVHRARTKDGRKLALKVLRPGVRELIEADIQLMSAIAALLEPRFSREGYSPTEVVGEFARQLERETDMVREGRSTDRLGRAFAEDETVRFAKVHWDLTTHDVLALEEIDGVPLSRMPPGSLTHEQRTRVIAHTTDAVFRQCLEIGFFHADPHPGNLVVLPGEVVCFLDCGMTGSIAPETALQLADLLRGVITRDHDTVVRAAVLLADADPALVYDRRFRSDVWEFMGAFDIHSLSELQVGAVLRDFFEVIQRAKLRCPADLVYLIKALGTAEGVAAELAPDFDVLQHVRPRLERLVRQRYGFGAMRRRLERALIGYGEILETMPYQLRELLDRIQRQHFGLKVEHEGLTTLTHTLDRSSMTLAYALLVGSLIVGSAVLLLADAMDQDYGWLTALGVLGVAAALAIGIWRIVRLWFVRDR
jgi:ubiquinone biosynthesis protein